MPLGGASLCGVPLVLRVIMPCLLPKTPPPPPSCRDVKLDNTLLDGEQLPTVKLCDFQVGAINWGVDRMGVPAVCSHNLSSQHAQPAHGLVRPFVPAAHLPDLSFLASV